VTQYFGRVMGKIEEYGRGLPSSGSAPATAMNGTAAQGNKDVLVRRI
jgi:hypothetical protein